MNYAEIGKIEARKRFVNGETIYVVPEGEHPESCKVRVGVIVAAHKNDRTREKFKIFVDDYIFDYCKFTEYKVDFYIKK